MPALDLLGLVLFLILAAGTQGRSPGQSISRAGAAPPEPAQCLAQAARRPMHQRSRARSACLNRYGRTPGRITKLHARAISSTVVMLTFAAAASDGQNPPAARAYLVKQSRHPIRGERDFRGAHTLCNGRCRFKVSAVGTELKLTILHLRPTAPTTTRSPPATMSRTYAAHGR